MPTRRVFLTSGLSLSGSVLLGCGDEAGFTETNPRSREASGDAGTQPPRGDGGALDCPDPFSTGRYLRDVPFVGESEIALDQSFNQGLDARLYTDLSQLTEDSLVTPNDAFYIRTAYPDRLTFEPPWMIRVHGRGLDEALRLDALRGDVTPQGTQVLECSGNARGASFGLMSSASWDGVPLLEVLERVGGIPDGARVLVSGFDEHSTPSANNHSTPGASWIFSAEQLRDTGAFLATRMNGEELPRDHGAPVRLLVPGWYGCTCIKWVNEIEFVDDDAPATSQMQEFASRTHQSGVPALARDYLPANMDTAAMPIRIERWEQEGDPIYRVVGIVWGGSEPVSELQIRFGTGEWQPVTICPRPGSTNQWALWEHRWVPETAGTYAIVLRVPDPRITTRRLDSAYYLREITV